MHAPSSGQEIFGNSEKCSREGPELRRVVEIGGLGRDVVKDEIEEIKRVCNMRLERIKRRSDPEVPLWKLYQECISGVRLYGYTCGQSFSAEYTFPDIEERAPVDRNQVSVLVWVGDVAQGLRPLRSAIRLQFLDEVPVWLRNAAKATIDKSVQFDFVAYRKVRVPAGDNWKLCPLPDYAGIFKGQLENQIVQRGSKIMNGIADGQGKVRRNGRHMELTVAASIRVVLIKDALFAFASEAGDERICLMNISSRPL